MNRLGEILNVVLTICAITVTALVVRREFFPPGQPRPAKVDQWERIFAEGRVIGPSDATVRIVEFTDFQCPFCAAAADRLSELLDEFPDDLAISVRHFPLGIHDQAQVASIAAECAAEQGHFRQMHDVLFDKQPDIGGTAWREFARMAEVPNIERFQDCIEQPSVADRVKADARLGTEIGVSATPSFIIDGRLHKTGLDAVQSIADAVRKR